MYFAGVKANANNGLRRMCTNVWGTDEYL